MFLSSVNTAKTMLAGGCDLLLEINRVNCLIKQFDI